MLNYRTRVKIDAEMRMHSNRVVTHKGVKKKLCELAKQPGVKLTGRQTARTISVEWHGLLLEVSIVKRVDKNDNQTIVFQVATYKAEPREHVKNYGARWCTEKMYRTDKQVLGLGECFSRSLVVQHNHAAATLLAYAFAQLEMKRLKLKTPEAAIRAIKEKFYPDTLHQFIDQYDFLTQIDA
jgi:SRSO17 transposase